MDRGQQSSPLPLQNYDKSNDKMSKSDHFRSLRQKAKKRGSRPACILFDSWYSSLDNLKAIGDIGCIWLTRLKMNSLLNPDGCGNVQIKELNIDADGLIVHLKGSGFIKVFKTVSKNRGLEYWATNDLKMSQTS